MYFIKERVLVVLIFFAQAYTACASVDVTLDLNDITEIADTTYDKEPGVFRVMTYNTGDFSGYDFLNGSEEGKLLYSSAIEKQRADIIGLQEDVAYYGNETLWSAIFKKYPYYYQYGDTEYNYKAFASAYPLENVRQVYYRKFIPYSHPYFLEGSLKWNSKKILLVSFHFDWDDKIIRRIQIEDLISFASQYETVILMGDTNCDDYLNGMKISDVSLHEEEWQLFKEAGYSLANNGLWGLFETFVNGKPLDNIFVKGCDIRKVYCVTEDYMNDHYMLIADLII